MSQGDEDGFGTVLGRFWEVLVLLFGAHVVAPSTGREEVVHRGRRSTRTKTASRKGLSACSSVLRFGKLTRLSQDDQAYLNTTLSVLNEALSVDALRSVQAGGWLFGSGLT